MLDGRQRSCELVAQQLHGRVMVAVDQQGHIVSNDLGHLFGQSIDCDVCVKNEQLCSKLVVARLHAAARNDEGG